MTSGPTQRSDVGLNILALDDRFSQITPKGAGAFLASLLLPKDIYTTTPRETCRSKMWKDQKGGIKVHNTPCQILPTRVRLPVPGRHDELFDREITHYY